MDNYIDKIQEAKFEAIKRGISANAVAISKDLYFSLFPTSGTPMICGLKAISTEELPDDTAFAVLELPLKTSNSPSADVVKVVRCKDCDVPRNKWTGCPNLNGLIPPPDFYCAKGKRKT